MSGDIWNNSVRGNLKCSEFYEITCCYLTFDLSGSNIFGDKMSTLHTSGRESPTNGTAAQIIDFWSGYDCLCLQMDIFEICGIFSDL